MNSIYPVKRHLNVSTAGHVVMFAFAAASLANVESFFAALHPGLPLLSWGLGIALGSGLLVMAGLLSGMAWAWTDVRFQVVVTVAGSLALLSGGIQAAAYAAHMASTAAAVIVGLSLPIVGELGVALAVSAYSQAQRRQRMTDAQTQLADGVRAQIGDAVAAIDPAKIRSQVDRAAQLVTRAIVDATVNDMLAELQQPASHGAPDSATDDAGDIAKVQPEAAISNQNAGFGSASLPDANAERQRLQAERRAAIRQLFQTYGQMGASDLQQRLQADRGIEASERTLRDDLAALVAAGGLVKIGRGVWDIARPVLAADQPAPVGFSVNGHRQE